MIQERLYGRIGKNESYKKSYMEAQKNKSKTIENEAEKNQKNLAKSAVD
jgi:hypothetical protein